MKESAQRTTRYDIPRAVVFLILCRMNYGRDAFTCWLCGVNCGLFLMLDGLHWYRNRLENQLRAAKGDRP